MTTQHIVEQAEITLKWIRSRLELAEDALARAKTIQDALDNAGFGETYCNVDPDGITFFTGDHADAMKLCGALGKFVGNRWDRRLASYDESKLSYSAKMGGADAASDFRLLITGVEPPAHCRIETYEVSVPAKVEKRTRVVCEP